MSNNQQKIERESDLPHTVDANNVSLGASDQKGLLSPLGDPLGKALNKGLSPVGSLVGGVAQPFGSGKSNSDKLSGSNKENDEVTKPIGGNEQTGQNPLGL